jgi:hypothetical protein
MQMRRWLFQCRKKSRDHVLLDSIVINVRAGTNLAGLTNLEGDEVFV